MRCWRGCNFCPVPITPTLGHCRPEMAKPAASRCPFWASKFTYLDENSYNFTQVQVGVLRFNPRGVRYLFQHHGLGNQFLRVLRNGLRVAARVVSSIHCCQLLPVHVCNRWFCSSSGFFFSFSFRSTFRTPETVLFAFVYLELNDIFRGQYAWHPI